MTFSFQINKLPKRTKTGYIPKWSSIIPDYGIWTPFFTASIPFVANGVALWSSAWNHS